LLAKAIYGMLRKKLKILTMEVRIEPYEAHQLEEVIRLSLRAWAPVFDSLQNVMNADVYQAFYPDHWHVRQQKSVEDICAAEDTNVWVARVYDRPEANDAGSLVGFVAVKLHSEDSMGEIYMVAVDPGFQGHGIGTDLIEFALAGMKEAGMSIAMVETGGDPGHAPARHTYEKAGFELLPIARYFKKL
jgi:ribosomal protein S18 acetylase RimI-like enzyme